MDELNFYTVSTNYVDFLKQAEQRKRGFSRVPNMEYGKNHKPKFLCGVILQVNSMDYYVPVSSFKEKKPDNFLILSDSNDPVSSLRFNYMFPIPKELTAIRQIETEPDLKYRALLAQELRFCIQHQEEIFSLAQRTYKRVLGQYSPSLVKNSCDFSLLEQKCLEYCQQHGLEIPEHLQGHIDENATEQPTTPSAQPQKQEQFFFTGAKRKELADALHKAASRTPDAPKPDRSKPGQDEPE